MRYASCFAALIAGVCLAWPTRAEALVIKFDYTYDTGGFFSGANVGRRAVLEAAADVFNKGLSAEHFAALVPTGGNSWTLSFRHPSTGGSVTLHNPVRPADTVIIYVGGTSTLNGLLGLADYRYSYYGDSAWGATMAARDSSTNFEPFGGSISFDQNANWYFDDDTSTLEDFPGQVDFYSLAQHEIGHLMGFSGGTNAFRAHSSAGLFKGANAMALYGGPVPLNDANHWLGGLTWHGQPLVMCPDLYPNVRQTFTDLDFAALKDIGHVLTTGAVGGVRVTLDNLAAVTAGARWQVDGGAWQTTGALVYGLTPGSHTISYRPLTTWITPASTIVTVALGQVNALTGSYVPLPPPSIDVPPLPLLVALNQPAAFAPTITGGAPLSYQWLKNNVAISKANASSYTLAQTTVASAGSFSVKVSNAVRSVTSTPVKLGIVSKAASAPVFNEGGTLSLTVVTGGTGLVYEWRKSGTVLQNGGRISGADKATLRIVHADNSDTAVYTCMVTMDGLALESGAFSVAVRLKPVVNSFTPAAWMVSSKVTDQVSAQNLPTKFTITGLPPGITYSTTTGLLSGKPAYPGNYTLAVTASNPAGTSAVVMVPLTVAKLPDNVVGTFNGLVEADSVLTTDFGGSLNTVITSTGTFSGTLGLGAKMYRYTGRLDGMPGGNPNATVSISRGSALPALRLGFTVDAGTGEIIGHVSDGLSANPSASAWRNPWSSTRLPASALHGAYTTALDLQQPQWNNPLYPQGSGFSFLTIDTSGGVKWVGTLADSTVMTVSTTMSLGGDVPLHALLYSSTGSAHGWIKAVAALPANHVDGSLAWIKNKQPDASTARSYKAGIPKHTIDVSGGIYARPAANGIVLDLPDQPDNGKLSFSGASVESTATAASLNQVFRLLKTGIGSMAPVGANPDGVKVTVTPATGAFSGSFVLKDADVGHSGQFFTRPVSFKGVIVPRLGRGAGCFQLAQLPAPASSPLLSGKVALAAP